MLKNNVHGFTIAELAKELDVSTKTIQRDLYEVLSDLGAIKEGRTWKIDPKLASDDLNTNERLILGILAALRGRQAQGHVVGHAFPGQQARVLEHDAGAVAQAAHAVAVDADGAARDRLQPRHQAQQRALAATAAAHDGDEFARLDDQVGLVEHAARAVALVHATHFQAHALGL